jgi:hypothetical protein
MGVDIGGGGGGDGAERADIEALGPDGEAAGIEQDDGHQEAGQAQSELCGGGQQAGDVVWAHCCLELKVDER